MDILQLVDRLEELFNESRPIPLTRNVIVDEDRFLDLIDQMRLSIPEDVKKAQQIYTQKDRLLAQAQEEAGRTLQQAREKVDQILEKDQISQEAQKRASQIIDQARLEAENVKAGADQYALEALMNLEMEMERFLTQVRNGILMLQEKGKNPLPTQQIEIRGKK